MCAHDNHFNNNNNNNNNNTNQIKIVTQIGRHTTYKSKIRRVLQGKMGRQSSACPVIEVETDSLLVKTIRSCEISNKQKSKISLPQCRM